MRRILMFVNLPPHLSASVKVNGEQFEGWFRSRGWELVLLPPFNWPGGWWLARKKGFARIMCYVVMPLQRLFEILLKIKPDDIVIVHKSLTTMQARPSLEAWLRRRHKHVIFNYDDAVYEAGIPFVDKRISLADAVWVGNPILADYSRRFCNRVELIESAVDCNHYSAKESYELHSPLQLVWSGTAFSQQYLVRLREPLKRLARRRPYVMTIISGKRFSFNDADICDTWVPFDASNEVACLKNADIALMPIDDGPYERAKENYKVKMYMACGLPLICSPVGINIHFITEGERGFFARTTDDWVSRIEQLADSQSLREQFGRAARLYAVKKYDIPVVGAQLLKLFESVLCAE